MQASINALSEMSQSRPGVRVEVGRTGPGFYEMLVDSAQAPTFPFFRIVLVETNKAQSADLELHVSPTIYENLRSIFLTEKILFYLDIPKGGAMQAWTADMLESIRILAEHKVMSREENWILKAREYLAHLLNGTTGRKAEIPYEDEEPLRFLQDILDAAGILAKIDADVKLLAVASDIINSGKKDFDSCIYRLTMAFYHSQRVAGRSAVPEIDDPGAAYLGIIGSADLGKKHPKLLESIRDWPESRRTDTTKTFICFCIASYLCHKVAREVRK